MKFCENCGAQLDDGVQFCAQCGTPVAPAAAQPASEPMPPIPTSTAPQSDYQIQNGQTQAAQGVANQISQASSSTEQIPQASGPGSPSATLPTIQPNMAPDNHKRRNIIIVVIAAVAVIVIALGVFLLTRPSRGKIPVSHAPATASGYPVGEWSLHTKWKGADASLVSVTVDKTGKASLRMPGGGDFIDVVDGQLGKPHVKGNSVTYSITKLNVPHGNQVVTNGTTPFWDDRKEDIQASTVFLTMPRKGVVGNWRVSTKVAGDKSSEARTYTMKVGADHTFTFGWDDHSGFSESGIRSGVWSKAKSENKDKQRITVEMESGKLMEDDQSAEDDVAEFYFEAPRY